MYWREEGFNQDKTHFVSLLATFAVGTPFRVLVVVRCTDFFEQF